MATPSPEHQPTTVPTMQGQRLRMSEGTLSSRASRIQWSLPINGPAGLLALCGLGHVGRAIRRLNGTGADRGTAKTGGGDRSQRADKQRRQDYRRVLMERAWRCPSPPRGEEV
jgi:hypothetical protein